MCKYQHLCALNVLIWYYSTACAFISFTIKFKGRIYCLFNNARIWFWVDPFLEQGLSGWVVLMPGFNVNEFLRNTLAFLLSQTWQKTKCHTLEIQLQNNIFFQVKPLKVCHDSRLYFVHPWLTFTGFSFTATTWKINRLNILSKLKSAGHSVLPKRAVFPRVVSIPCDIHLYLF